MVVRNRKVLIILGSLLVLVIAVGGFVLINGKLQESSYNEAIDTAEKFLLENDYETAIIHYEEAIDINPEDTDAYLGLADVYVRMENFAVARAVLKQGYQVTGSPKLEYMLNRLYSADIDGKQSDASGDVDWNTPLLQKLSAYTFSDYKEKFGAVQHSEKDEDGYLRVVHSGLDGVCFYRNTTDDRKIVNTTSGKPYADAMPEKIQMNSITSVFRNFNGEIELETLQIMVGDRVQPKSEDERYLLELETNDCIIRVETDNQGNILSRQPWNEILLLNANQNKRGGQVSGIVLDAVTGEGVRGAELVFEPKGSKGKKETAESGTGGTFDITLEPGNYEVTITADDYIQETFSFEAKKGKSYSGEEFVISPSLASGTARIVLEWNAEPYDLDSYLTGETSDGHNVDVNYTSQKEEVNGETVAELDLDDTNGFGPETTTIYDLNGTYTFSVEDFGHTGTMAQHGATVKIYMPNEKPKTVSLSTGSGVENLWVVCKIDHGKLTILNKAQ